LDQPGALANWAWMTILSMLAILFLPRQFQVAVIENVEERHLKTAVWLFPLYMLAINVFVLPIAFGGLLTFDQGGLDADSFVLTLPMSRHMEALTLLVFVGGISAATGMVIVETIALSTMVSNDLIMPLMLRWRGGKFAQRTDLPRVLLDIRRGAIVVILLLGYAYFVAAGEAYALVSIGLVSFAAGGAVRSGAAGRPLLEGCHAQWRAGGPVERLRGVALHAAPARVREVGVVRHGDRDERARSNVAMLKPTQLFGPHGARPDRRTR
jgi:Na+/proline symporter